MVGYVIHIWRPNHPNKMYRTPLNRDVYLIEIGKNYVPVTGSGLRQYNQAMDSNQKEMEALRRNSLQREMNELRQQHMERGLTPILGSSLESPTSLLAEGERNTSGTGHKSKIQAVSSSSSEDESCLLNLEKERQQVYLKNIWDQVLEQEQNVKHDLDNPTVTLTNPIANDQTTSISINKSKTTPEEPTTTSSPQTVSKHTDSTTTTPNEAPTLSEGLVPDSGTACAKQLVDQLVDHVLDDLCDTIDSKVAAEKSQLLKQLDEAGIEEDDQVEIIETENDEHTNEFAQENLDEDGNIVYNI